MVWVDILPGYAGCVELELLHLQLKILCVYTRPGSERNILDSVSKFMKSSAPYLRTTVLVGDANSLRSTTHFSDTLAQHDLRDVCTLTDVPLQTYVHPKGQSSLDFIAVSASLLDVSGWTASTVIRERNDNSFGHKFLFLSRRPPKKVELRGDDLYSRLPDKQFQSTQHSCRVLPALMAQHLPPGDMPSSLLVKMNAFFQAFATTLRSQHTLSPGFPASQSQACLKGECACDHRCIARGFEQDSL